MAAVDIENMDFDVEISEESDLHIVLASLDESLEILMTVEDVNTKEYENFDTKLQLQQKAALNLLENIFFSKKKLIKHV